MENSMRTTESRFRTEDMRGVFNDEDLQTNVWFSFVCRGVFVNAKKNEQKNQCMHYDRRRVQSCVRTVSTVALDSYRQCSQSVIKWTCRNAASAATVTPAPCTLQMIATMILRYGTALSQLQN